VVIPTGVNEADFRYLEPRDRPPTFVFFGNLGYFHNSAPAAFLATEVLARVRADHPGAMLLLAGARPSASVRRLTSIDGVELDADPPSMGSVLHRAAVAAVPMFSGSGMKNKLLEAFCAGTPVVANAAGVEGIDEAVPGEHFLPGEDAAGIAAAISRLLGNPEERVRLAGDASAMVRRQYTWERQAARMLGVYRSGPAKPPRP